MPVPFLVSKATHNKEGILSKLTTDVSSKNHGGQKAMGLQSQGTEKKKNLNIKNFSYLAETILQK